MGKIIVYTFDKDCYDDYLRLNSITRSKSCCERHHNDHPSWVYKNVFTSEADFTKAVNGGLFRDLHDYRYAIFTE